MTTAHIETLAGCALFECIAVADISAMLDCLSARRQQYGKGEVIFAQGTAAAHVGIVLSGGARIEQDDYWGNRSILARVGPAELFGEAFSCAGVQRLPVNVYAIGTSEILLIDYRKIVTSCSAACVFHAQLIQNMLRILAEKNVALTRKMEALTQRTTRDKLLAYLSQQAQRQGGNAFTIPFNRQELADYLAVDRSAMSSALAAMRREGVLRFDRSSFVLL